jgi:8-oxo-dGTP pyrophosphatase MutT (NUDIX family)
MNVPKWLEPPLRWLLWRFRAKYLVGVFPVCIDDGGHVALIRKRLGAATGWQLPGGGKQYGVSPQDAACHELEQETGLKTYSGCLELVDVRCVERFRDLNIVYLVRTWTGELRPKDTTEIAEARWVHISEAYGLIHELHVPLLIEAADVFYAWRTR